MKPRCQSTLIAFVLAFSVRAEAYLAEDFFNEASQHYIASLPVATMAGAPGVAGKLSRIPSDLDLAELAVLRLRLAIFMLVQSW